MDCLLSAAKHCAMHLASTCLLLNEVASKMGIFKASCQSAASQTQSRADNPATMENLHACHQTNCHNMQWDPGCHANKNLADCKLLPKPVSPPSKPSLEKANALTMDTSQIGSALQSQKRIGIDSGMTACLGPEKSVPELALVCWALQHTVNGWRPLALHLFESLATIKPPVSHEPQHSLHVPINWSFLCWICCSFQQAPQKEG